MSIRWLIDILRALATDNVERAMFISSTPDGKARLKDGVYIVYRAPEEYNALTGEMLANIVQALADDNYRSIIIVVWKNREVLHYFLLVQYDKEHPEHPVIIRQIEARTLSRSSVEEFNQALSEAFGIQRSYETVFRAL